MQLGYTDKLVTTQIQKLKNSRSTQIQQSNKSNTAKAESEVAEMSRWDQANRGENLGLVWRNRKKTSQLFYANIPGSLPFLAAQTMWAAAAKEGAWLLRPLLPRPPACPPLLTCLHPPSPPPSPPPTPWRRLWCPAPTRVSEKVANIYFKNALKRVITSLQDIIHPKQHSAATKMWNALRFCVSSLRRGHANLLCIAPTLVYVLPKQAHLRVR